MRQRRYYMGGGRLGGVLTPGIKWLLIVFSAGYILQLFSGERVNNNVIIPLFGLTPAAFWDHFAVWQPVTYMLLHGGLFHLLLNMLILWMFGGVLESVWGTKRFMKFFFITGIGAGLFNCIFTPTMGIPIIGASGAIYGLLAAYGILFPNSIIYVWGILPIRTKYLVIGIGVFTFISSLRPESSGIAHLVHLGGMLIGVLYLRKELLMRWGARKVKSWQREQDLQREKKKIDTENHLQEEVDDLLDKINEVGIDNLTTWEKRRLSEASKRLREMEGKEG